jgi:hypothetical protein
MLLATPESIRMLQRKLYAKAKQACALRYALPFERADATSSVVLTNARRNRVHALV